MVSLWALSSVYISLLWGITALVTSSIHFGTTSPALHWLLLLWVYQVEPADYTFLKSTNGILELPSISCRIYHYIQRISILDISLGLLTSLSIYLLNITPWKSNMQLNFLPSKQNSWSFPSTVCHTHCFHYFNFWKSHPSSCSCQNSWNFERFIFLPYLMSHLSWNYLISIIRSNPKHDHIFYFYCYHFCQANIISLLL